MELNGRWKGGRMIDMDGYVLLKRPDHPRARKAGYILEHRLVMEQTLGRPLERTEIVHHINGVKADNRPENLAIMTQAAHMKVERTGKKFPRADGGHYVCEGCGGTFYRSAYWRDQTVRWCSWKCRYPHSER